MNFIHTHHHGVVIAAGIGGLVVILVIIFLLLRKKEPVDTFAEGEVHKIEERLATGHFSRKPSAFRRKVVDIQESRLHAPAVEEKTTPVAEEIVEAVSTEVPVMVPEQETPAAHEELSGPDKPGPFLTPGFTAKSNLFMTPQVTKDDTGHKDGIKDKEERGSH